MSVPSSQFQKLRQILFIRRRPPMPVPVAVERLRANFEALALPAAADVAVTSHQIAGMPVEELMTPGADPGRTVLYLHGGGYVMGSPHSHRKLAGDVSRAAGARVLVPDYPLAPEHPFPAAIESIGRLYDCLAAPTSAARLAIAGDSAGGGLTAATLISLRDRGAMLPAAAVLISPWLDLVRDGGVDAALAARDPIVAAEDLDTFRRWYLRDADPREPLASPVLADLRGLPPMLIQVGSDEIVAADSRRFTERCGSAELEVWDEMVHVWHVFAGRVPEATAAVERIGVFLRAHLA
jgi:monoterpene epsilon-lactone hydrolase